MVGVPEGIGIPGGAGILEGGGGFTTPGHGTLWLAGEWYASYWNAFLLNVCKLDSIEEF